VPQTFGYVASNAPSTFIIEGNGNLLIIFYDRILMMYVNISTLGSARFLKEPFIENIKDVNLKQLSENLWMANQDTTLCGNNIYFENITLTGDIILKVKTLVKQKISYV